MNAFAQHKSLNDLLDLYDSRYRTDFEEKSMLGKGGFGSVWMVSLILDIGPLYKILNSPTIFKIQAKNKLNGIMYAIKKIRLKDNFNSYEKVKNS